jgi:hypothetical protein
LTALKQWYYPEYSDEFSEDVARRAGSKANPTLGDAEGRVTQAAAETEKDLKPLPAKTEGRTGAFVSRKLGTLILKSLIPDDVQQLVPNEAFKKLEEPPSAETLQKREDRRKQLEERRRQRLKSRLLPSPNEE